VRACASHLEADVEDGPRERAVFAVGPALQRVARRCNALQRYSQASGRAPPIRTAARPSRCDGRYFPRGSTHTLAGMHARIRAHARRMVRYDANTPRAAVLAQFRLHRSGRGLPRTQTQSRARAHTGKRTGLPAWAPPLPAHWCFVCTPSPRDRIGAAAWRACGPHTSTYTSARAHASTHARTQTHTHTESNQSLISHTDTHTPLHTRARARTHTHSKQPIVGHPYKQTGVLAYTRVHTHPLLPRPPNVAPHALRTRI
jgi:hypothetical protein